VSGECLSVSLLHCSPERQLCLKATQITVSAAQKEFHAWPVIVVEVLALIVLVNNLVGQKGLV